MQTLHLFNPSHDEALAAHTPFYTPASAARRLEHELALLPCHYAKPGDIILVPDNFSGAPPETARDRGITLAHWKSLPQLRFETISAIEPWGWDVHIVHRLRRAGVPERLLPTVERLNTIRNLSSRMTAVQLLRDLRAALPNTVGESSWCTTTEATLQAIEAYGNRAVLKAPWSCSGRGVFWVTLPLTASTEGRLQRILREQGGIEVEPHYERVLDFAMEFQAETDGHVAFKGLSLFKTDTRGGYVENHIAPDEVLAAEIAAAGCEDNLHEVAESAATCLSEFLQGHYSGPLGIDMMLARTDGKTRLHPCIEVNLRRTMGWVAMAKRD